MGSPIQRLEAAEVSEFKNRFPTDSRRGKFFTGADLTFICSQSIKGPSPVDDYTSFL